MNDNVNIRFFKTIRMISDWFIVYHLRTYIKEKRHNDEINKSQLHG